MMKKIFALLIVFAMALCFVACGPTEEAPTGNACTEHVDNNGDGICDTEGCGATVGNNGGAADDVESLAKALVGEGASLSKITATGDYVKEVYVDANGKGYVVHLLVMSQYGTAETETLVYINAEGKLAGVKKMVWKTSDAMYGYVPPEASVVDAFYAKLIGKTADEFETAFTGEGVELVTNATSTSTKLVASIMEAFEIVDAIKNGGNVGGGAPVNPEAAAGYANAIFAAVESAKTVTATLNMTTVEKTTDAVDADGNVIGEAYSAEMNVLFNLTFAMTENGLNIKAIGEATMSEIYEGEPYEDTQKFEAYVVDGVCYTRMAYSEEWTEWEVVAIELPEEAAGMLTQISAIIGELIPADFEITPEMIAEVKAAAAAAISEMMTVNPDGSFGATADVKPAINAVLDFIKGIKKEDTVGATINKVLALIDPEMTIEQIVDEAGTYGAVTVGEIYTALNEAITEEYGMSINDIKNAILAEEAIVAILIDNGIVDEEMLAAIAENDVEVIIAEYTEMTIDDIVYMMFAAQSSPEVDAQPIDDEPVNTAGTLAAMAEEVKAMLVMTVENALGGEYDNIMAIVKSFNVRAYYGYVNFKIGESFSIDKIEIGSKVDFSVTAPVTEYVENQNEEGEYQMVPVECTVTATNKQEIKFTITSVSNTETVITAPEVVLPE